MVIFNTFFSGVLSEIFSTYYIKNDFMQETLRDRECLFCRESKRIYYIVQEF